MVKNRIIIWYIVFHFSYQGRCKLSRQCLHYSMQALALFFGSIAFISRKKQKFGGSNAWLLLEIPSVLVMFFVFLHITYQQIMFYPVSCLLIVGSIIAWILILTGRKSSADEIQKKPIMLFHRSAKAAPGEKRH